MSNREDGEPEEKYDWAGFYGALCSSSHHLLRGIDGDDDIREIISLVSDTDAFWSEGLQSLLADAAADGDLRRGVLASLDLWRENVLTVLSEDFAVDLDWGTVIIDIDSPLIEDLVRAATPSRA